VWGIVSKHTVRHPQCRKHCDGFRDVVCCKCEKFAVYECAPVDAANYNRRRRGARVWPRATIQEDGGSHVVDFTVV
jgi:hypothetical protein